MLYYGVWGLCYSSTNTTRDTDGEATPYSFYIMAKNNTRDLILDKTYRLLFIYNWEAITIEQIEGSIGRTRGAIFISSKTKANCSIQLLMNDSCRSF